MLLPSLFYLSLAEPQYGEDSIPYFDGITRLDSAVWTVLAILCDHAGW